MSASYIHLHPRDNVLTALENLEAGRTISLKGRDLKLKKDVPAKHKFAWAELKVGDAVIMYGITVGKVTGHIPSGDLLSVDNVTNELEKYSAETCDYRWTAPDVKTWKSRTFDGYHRPDGRVGTANHWLVLPLTFCENHNIEVLKSTLADTLGYPAENDFKLDIQPLLKSYQEGAGIESLLETPIVRHPRDMKRNRVFSNVDGIKFLTHSGGCGGTREDADTLCRLLAGYITHPNVAGATILSLGCQHIQIKDIRNTISRLDPSFTKPLVVLEQQQHTSERDFLAEAAKRTFVGLIEANKNKREPAPLSKLIVGLECGGSDGFSGISANPTLGYVSDLLVALGGIAILSEFPELNGVEQDLLNRCTERKLADKFALLMQQYSERVVAAGSGFDKNPSPGNIKDGLITNTMKSAGAAKKGGSSPITAVLDYTEQAVIPGLNLLCTPGNDVESTTGLTGSGANVILFSTGLGTPTGNPVCPVIKVSSDTPLYNRMRDIIDFDTGPIIHGGDTIPGKGAELLEYIIEVASGHAVPAAVRLSKDDFIPWKRGFSL